MGRARSRRDAARTLSGGPPPPARRARVGGGAGPPRPGRGRRRRNARGPPAGCGGRAAGEGPAQRPAGHARHHPGGPPGLLRVRRRPDRPPRPSRRRGRAVRARLRRCADHAALPRLAADRPPSLRARGPQQRQLLPSRQVRHAGHRPRPARLPDGGVRQRLRPGPPIRPGPRLRDLRRPDRRAGRHRRGRGSGAPRRPHGAGVHPVARRLRERRGEDAVLRLASPLRPARAVPSAAAVRRFVRRSSLRRRGRLRGRRGGLGPRPAAAARPSRPLPRRRGGRPRREPGRPRRGDALDVPVRERHPRAAHPLAPPPPARGPRRGVARADRRRGPDDPRPRRGAAPRRAAGAQPEERHRRARTRQRHPCTRRPGSRSST